MSEAEQWAKEQIRGFVNLDLATDWFDPTQLVSLLDYFQLDPNGSDSDNWVLRAVNNDINCTLSTCSEADVLRFYSGFSADPGPALQGFLFVRMITLGQTSALWSQLPWAERASLYALRAHLTPLPTMVAFEKLDGDKVYQAARNARGKGLCGEAYRAFRDSWGHSRPKSIDLSELKDLPIAQKKLRKALSTHRACQDHSCADLLMEYVDISVEAMFTEIYDLCKKVCS
ncbi:hypothetical protein RhiJN_26035 [Ceratobasidium sp. AG-Ba]|nr:hypothetical protein RhiJN_26035 [Ceratobasidium sp. AG-Ba]